MRLFGLLAVAVIGFPGGPTSATPYTIYVCSESADIVTRIEVSADGWKKIREIPVGWSPADIAGPHNVAVSPDGRFWYVSIAHGQPFGAIWKFKTGTDSLLGKAPVGMFPTTVGLSPDGDWAFIPNSDFHGDRGHLNTVSVIYTPDMTSLAEVPTCDMPHGSRVSHHGATAYIACMMSDELVAIDASTFGITNRVNVGSGHPMPANMNMDAPPGAASSTMRGQNPDCLTTYVSVSPNDSTLYLACNHGGSLQVRDARTLALIKTVPTGAGAYNVEPSPDGKFVLVTNKKAQSVSIFDAKTLAELARVPTSKKVPHGIAFSPDGRYAFVSCESVGTDAGAVDAIDLTTRTRIASFDVPRQPTGIAVWRGA
jgi:YVTN family beta-propeller protein